MKQQAETPPVFAGKRILVIGGTGGIGAALAKKLLDAGGKVSVIGRHNPFPAKDNPAPERHAAVFLPLNLDDPACLPDLTAAAAHTDVLCVVRGPFLQKPLHETSGAEWMQTVFANLAVPGAAVSAALPGMRSRRWGRILLFGGTNQMLTEAYITEVLDKMDADTLVLLQNETNLVGFIMEEAHKRGMKTALNAAPMDEKVLSYPLELLDWLIVNEVEGKQIANCQTDDEILPVLRKKYPDCGILLTLGSRGAICDYAGETYQIGCFKVPVVDTTAAGDTFTGYFLYGMGNGLGVADSLLLATTASAMAIGKKGAADSVPLYEEVAENMKNQVFGTLKAQKK